MLNETGLGLTSQGFSTFLLSGLSPPWQLRQGQGDVNSKGDQVGGRNLTPRQKVRFLPTSLENKGNAKAGLHHPTRF